MKKTLFDFLLAQPQIFHYILDEIVSFPYINQFAQKFFLPTPNGQEALRLYFVNKLSKLQPKTPAQIRQFNYLSSFIIKNQIQRGLLTVKQALYYSSPKPQDTPNVSHFVEGEGYYLINRELISLGISPFMIASTCIHKYHHELVKQHYQTMKTPQNKEDVSELETFFDTINQLTNSQSQAVLLGLPIDYVKTNITEAQLTSTHISVLKTLKEKAEKEKDSTFSLQAACEKIKTLTQTTLAAQYLGIEEPPAKPVTFTRNLVPMIPMPASKPTSTNVSPMKKPPPPPPSPPVH